MPTSSAYPPVIGVELLSALLGKSVGAIIADRSRARHRIPPACTPPGTRQPRWLTVDVLIWLAQYREPPTTPPAPLAPAPHRRGRPKKAEQIAARVAAAQRVAK